MNVHHDSDGSDQPSTLLFSAPAPEETVTATAVLPEGGVWDVVAEVWPVGVEPPGPSFVYPAAARNVTWRLVNRVTGQQVYVAPRHVAGAASGAAAN